MIAILLLLQAAAAQPAPPPPALGAIGRQDLPSAGCAAYLWSLDEPRRLVAMVEPARLRVEIDGKALDLARLSAEGAAGLGLASTTRYAAGDLTATVALTVIERGDIAKGAIVSGATLTLARAGGDATVTPLAGMAGCR